MLCNAHNGKSIGGGKQEVEKPVYQDADSKAPNYLKNRRALVGPACIVNSMSDGIKVLTGVKNLQNLCNENLDDYTSFPHLAEVVLGGSPIISIKDTKSYYAAGMEAGFTVCDDDAKVLGLDLATFYAIQFIKDGVNIGNPQPIKQGQDITGLELSLVSLPTINGKKFATKTYVAEAPGEFNEIKLVQLGVEATLAKSALNVKYAFVGKAREYTVTANEGNGIAKYTAEMGRNPFTLETRLSTHNNVIDADLTNSSTLSAVLQLGAAIPVTVYATPAASDKEEAFPAGTEIGFKVNSKSLLSLGLFAGGYIELFDKQKKSLGKIDLNLDLVKLGVIKATNEGVMVVKAPKDFSGAAVELTGVKVNLGADVVYYAFVRMAPDLASHHCPIEADASCNVSGSVNQFTLNHNGSIDVTWSIEKQPVGADIVLDSKTGQVSDIYVPGDYVFVATAADGCSEKTTVHYAPFRSLAEQGVTLLVNDEKKNPKYALSDSKGGGLLDIFDGIKDGANILSSNLATFCHRVPGVELLANKSVIGVRSLDGSSLYQGTSRSSSCDKIAGFVVSVAATGLDAKLLDMFTVKVLKNGKIVGSDLPKFWDAISAGLIGSEDTKKMRLSIKVPKEIDFDEIVLYTTGVLGLNLSSLNIYYAFVCDADQDNAINNMLYGADIISEEETDATIDYKNSIMFSVADIGNGYNQLSRLIDGNYKTGMRFPMGVNLGGATIAVNLGKKVNAGRQLVLVTNHVTLGLGVNLGKGLKVTTYLDDDMVEELKSWKVLGANVIGQTGPGYLVLNTTKPFNNVRITQAEVASALNGLEITGLALTNEVDANGNQGVSDEKFLVLDEDVTLDEGRTYENATMVFHRTFNTGKWNSLILPVPMTTKQLKGAFGEDMMISEFKCLEDNWIYFTNVDTNKEGTVLESNKPYIIYPTKEPEMVDRNYNTGDDVVKHISGPVYVVTGINYEGQPASLKHESKGQVVSGMTYYGSYESRAAIPTGAYMLNGGTMVHTAKLHNVKGYRAWLEEDNPSGKLLQMAFSSDDNNATGIESVEEHQTKANTGVYSISGMRINDNGSHLPKGVYIINNKKVIVK